MLHGVGLGNVFLDTLLAAIEGDFASAGTDVAIVGIGHFARAVDDAAHDADLQAHEVARGRFDAPDGVLQVVERAAAAGTGDVLGLGEFYAGSLKDGVL